MTRQLNSKERYAQPGNSSLNGSAAASSVPGSMAGDGVQEAVLSIIENSLRPPARVLDLAAGEGSLTKELVRRGFEVVPVDIVKEQWKLPEVELHAMDLDGNFADGLVQKAGAFDAVMAVEILEHVENPFSFIRQCSRLLRPGGKLFLTTPNVETPRSRVLFLLTGRLITFGVGETERLSHITPIFGWKLRMMLAEAGFVCRIEKFKPEALLPSANYKVKFTSIAARLLAPFMKGEKNDATRLVVAELGEVE